MKIPLVFDGKNNGQNAGVRPCSREKPNPLMCFEWAKTAVVQLIELIHKDWAAGYAVSAIAHVLIEKMPPGRIGAGIVETKQTRGSHGLF